MTKPGAATLAWVCAALPLMAQPNLSVVPDLPENEEKAYTAIARLFQAAQYQLALTQSEAFLRQFARSIRQADVSFIRAECLHALGRIAQARQSYSNYLARFPTNVHVPEALFRLGEIAYAEARFEQAALKFKELLDQHSESQLAGEAAYWIGESRYRLREQTDALKYFEICYQFYPSNRLVPFAMYSAGWIHRHLGHIEAALDVFRRLAERFPSHELTPSTHVRIAECHFILKNYEAVIRHLLDHKNELTNADDLAEARYLLTESYYRTDNDLDALLTAQEFLDIHRGHRLEREVRYTLSWVFYRERNYEKAAESFAALSVGNDSLARAALYHSGVARKLAGQTDDAFATLTACSETGGEFADNALYQLGLLRYGERRYGEAREFFARLANQYPTSDVLAAAYRMLGEVNLALEKFTEALEAFQRVRTIPGAPIDVLTDAQFQEGMTLMKLQRYPEAAGVFSDFIAQRRKDPRLHEAYFWMAEADYFSSNYTKAAEAYTTLLQTYPESPRATQARYGIAWCMYKMQDCAAAAQWFEQVAQSQQADADVAQDVQLNLAECYFALENYAAAERAYRTVVRRFPTNPSVEYARYRIAQCAIHTESPGEALAEYLDFLSDFPQSEFADDAMYDMGWILLRDQDYRSAIRQFRSLLTYFPQSHLVPATYAAIGKARQHLRQYARAIESYRVVTEQYPASDAVVEALRGMQESLASLGKHNDAAGAISAFLQRHPDSPHAEALMLADAEFLFKRKEYEKAVRAYNALIEAFPNGRLVPDALFGLARTRRALNDQFEAERILRDLAERHPTSRLAPEALLEIGLMSVDQARYGDAIAAFEQVEARYPASPSAVRAAYERGMAYLETQSLDEAERQFQAVMDRRRAIDLSLRATLGLGRVRQQQNVFDEAIKLFSAVVGQGSDEIAAEAQYRIGETLFLQQRYKEALEQLQRVQTAYPAARSAIAQAFLKMGECYERLSNKARARQAYRSVIKLHKDDKFGKEAQQKMKALEGA